VTLAYHPDGTRGDLSADLARVTDADPAPACISLRNLAKSFPRRRGFEQIIRRPFTRIPTPVIRGISFDVREGELFGILGLNGAGKTTLLKMLATLIVPDGGRAIVGGYDVSQDGGAVRGMTSMVTADERSLNWRLSGLENMRLFAGLHRMNRQMAEIRISETLEAVGLLGAGTKLVGSYSSGMRQRLILARALLPRPAVLLMDEPTRSLDPVSAQEFRRMLRDEIVDRGGTTVVLATHNSEEAFAYCDRVAVIHQGRVAALGSGRELAARFGQNRYRIGTSNPNHPAFDALVLRGLISALDRTDADDGSSVECVVTGDDDTAAEVLRRLVEAQVRVSRFERAPLPLSSLIARIVASHESESEGDNA
jgi:ABC-type multidrug transport system ATPase subunit